MQISTAQETAVYSLQSRLIRAISFHFAERDLAFNKRRAALISGLIAEQKIQDDEAFSRTKDLYASEFVERRKLIVREASNLPGATESLNEVKEVCVAMLQMQMQSFIEKMKEGMPFKIGGHPYSAAAAQTVIVQFLEEFDSHKNILETEIEAGVHKITEKPEGAKNAAFNGNDNTGNVSTGIFEAGLTWLKSKLFS
jgi:hypothetical protein